MNYYVNAEGKRAGFGSYIMSRSTDDGSLLFIVRMPVLDAESLVKSVMDMRPGTLHMELLGEVEVEPRHCQFENGVAEIEWRELPPSAVRK